MKICITLYYLFIFIHVIVTLFKYNNHLNISFKYNYLFQRNDKRNIKKYHCIFIFE